MLNKGCELFGEKYYEFSLVKVYNIEFRARITKLQLKNDQNDNQKSLEIGHHHS